MVHGKTVSFETESVPGVRRFCQIQAAEYCSRKVNCRVAGGKGAFKCILVFQRMNTQPY